MSPSSSVVATSGAGGGALSGMDASQSDHIGMLGTVMNGLALQDSLERHGQDTRLLSAIEMPRIAEPYIRRRAMRHLEKGRVVIFAAGTGNPFFTTDTAAALRAAEIEADALLKGTHSGVDGVYSADPRTDNTATKYHEIGYLEVMTKNLKVMDATASRSAATTRSRSSCSTCRSPVRCEESCSESTSAPSFVTSDEDGYAGRVTEEALLEAIEKMEKAVEHVQSLFATVRTGRAAPALVEKLNVDYYGSMVPLQQLAAIQVPEARQLLVLAALPQLARRHREGDP